MTGDYVPAPKKTYTQVAIENALAEKDQLGISTRAFADKHNVPYSTLDLPKELDGKPYLPQIRYINKSFFFTQIKQPDCEYTLVIFLYRKFFSRCFLVVKIHFV